MTTPDKIEIAVDGVDILAEAMRSVANHLDILAETVRKAVEEWQRFKDEVPHQTGQLRR